MKKGIACLLCILIIVFTFIPFSFVTFAAEQTEDIAPTQLGTSDTYYAFDSKTKTLTISGEGATPDLSNSKTQPWFEWRTTSIDKVVVEEGITVLGKYIFCSVSAGEFKLADSITSIKEGAFYSVNNTAEIVLPKNLESIGAKAFYSSVSLEKVFIPKKVKTIGMNAFEGCSKLSRVAFESDYMTVSLSTKAFFKCASLKNISLPRNAKLSSWSVGYSAATAGSVYNGFTLDVYRDSAAYTFANKNAIDVTLRDTMRLAPDDIITREYLSTALGDVMYFTYIPDVTDVYTFASGGDVDVDCTLLDSDGRELGTYSDNSKFDTNFTAQSVLQAGETYTCKVNSNMSVGAFSVSLIQSHSYVQEIAEPDLYNNGYTLDTCIYCGYQYKHDFTERTGKDIWGTVVLMENPQGGHSSEYPLYNISVSADDYVTNTDENGAFYLTVPKETESITLSSPYGVDRTVMLNDSDLGNLVFFAYDFVQDGYVNAKDYAWFCTHFGLNDRSLDYNDDGIVDRKDWSFAEEYFTYGKITERIYD